MPGTGRCDGCGITGSTAKVIRHVLDCKQWHALYAKDSVLARDPETAYVAWLSGGRAVERESRKRAAIEQENEKRAAASRRFATPRDILE